jgi:hypothetical protein
MLTRERTVLDTRKSSTLVCLPYFHDVALLRDRFSSCVLFSSEGTRGYARVLRESSLDNWTCRLAALLESSDFLAPAVM